MKKMMEDNKHDGETIRYTLHDNGRGENPNYPPKATNPLRSGYNERKRRTKRERRKTAECEEETDWSSASVLATTNHHDHEPPRTDGIVCTVVVCGHVNNEHVRCQCTGRPYKINRETLAIFFIGFEPCTSSVEFQSSTTKLTSQRQGNILSGKRNEIIVTT